MKPDERLTTLLKQRRAIDIEIGQIVTGFENHALRFSTKKFVGDLGEFYFSQLATCFSSLKQSTTSNFDCDFIGTLTNAKDIFDFDLDIVRIEVKTRHAQEGNNHLFGIHPKKFDLLAFVALSDEYDCRHIGLIRSEDIVVDRQNRIRYSDYYNNGLVRWKTNDWIEL